MKKRLAVGSRTGDNAVRRSYVRMCACVVSSHVRVALSLCATVLLPHQEENARLALHLSRAEECLKCDSRRLAEQERRLLAYEAGGLPACIGRLEAILAEKDQRLQATLAQSGVGVGAVGQWSSHCCALSGTVSSSALLYRVKSSFGLWLSAQVHSCSHWCSTPLGTLLDT